MHPTKLVERTVDMNTKYALTTDKIERFFAVQMVKL